MDDKKFTEVSELVTASDIKLVDKVKSRNGIISFNIQSPTSLTQLFSLINKEIKFAIASLGGDIILTHKKDTPPPPPSKKRKHQDDYEIKIHQLLSALNKKEKLTEAQNATIKKLLAALFSLKHNDTPTLERIAVSAKESSENARPKLILAARLLAGVPLDVQALQAALTPCTDGLVTVDSSTLANEFKLPDSDLGKTIETFSNEKPLLIYASIPE